MHVNGSIMIQVKPKYEYVYNFYKIVTNSSKKHYMNKVKQKLKQLTKIYIRPVTKLYNALNFPLQLHIYIWLHINKWENTNKTNLISNMKNVANYE